MRFYVISDADGSVIDCTLTIARAREVMRTWPKSECEAVDCDVSTETIRRLLGQIGGYARSTKHVKFTLAQRQNF